MEGRVRGLGMFLLSFRLHSEREKERERFCGVEFVSVFYSLFIYARQRKMIFFFGVNLMTWRIFIGECEARFLSFFFFLGVEYVVTVRYLQRRMNGVFIVQFCEFF